MKVAIYETATGEIVIEKTYESSLGTTGIAADVPAGCDWLQIPDTDPGAEISMDTHYVSGGAFTLRPVLYESDAASIVADGGATLAGKVEFAMPADTVVRSLFHETEQTSTAENFTFQTVRQGEYVFEFEPPFPYGDLILEINADAV